MYRYAQILNNKVHWIFEDSSTLDEIYAEKFNRDQIRLIDISAADFDNVREGFDFDGINFTDPNIETLDEAKTRYIKAAGAEFARRRDAITYVTQSDGITIYGYDRQAEDVINFMTARERAKLSEPVPYKVYKSDGTKGLVDHTLTMFDACLNQSATEQLAAYEWYEQIKAQINACTTIAKLEAITW